MGREMGLVLSRQINTWGLGVGFFFFFFFFFEELQAGLLIRSIILITSIISINQSVLFIWSKFKTN